MSLTVAGRPALVTTVLSVILNERDFSLPAMVNVFAFSSVDAIMPWNVIGCSFDAGEAAGDAVGLAFIVVAGRADTPGDGEVLDGAPGALSGRSMPIRARPAPRIR